MRKITALLLALVMLVGGFAGGYFIGNKDAEEYSPYDVIYKNLNGKDTQGLLDYYQTMLKAETSPAQLKYVLNKIIDSNIDNDVKNNMLAFYLNHIQYYMSTYSNFITMYSTIMLNNRSTVNYEDPSVVNVINDKVLRTVLQEIYASDMKVKMPPATSTDGRPYVIVNYDTITKEYGSILNSATKDYIEFKEIVQNGLLSNADGSYNMDKVGEYMIKANNFVNNHGDYPLISDVIYSYIIAAKMYIGTYNMSEAYTVDETSLQKYKDFVEKYPDTPVASTIKELIDLGEKGEQVTLEKANEWNEKLEALISD